MFKNYSVTFHENSKYDRHIIDCKQVCEKMWHMEQLTLDASIAIYIIFTGLLGSQKFQVQQLIFRNLGFNLGLSQCLIWLYFDLRSLFKSLSLIEIYSTPTSITCSYNIDTLICFMPCKLSNYMFVMLLVCALYSSFSYKHTLNLHKFI